MSIRIEELHFVETGTYNDAYYRPFISNFDEGEKNLFMSITANSDRVTPTLIGEVAGMVLKPQVQVNRDQVIAMPNGWGQRRFNFMMRVVPDNALGSNTYTIVTGYTDHQDVSISQHLDPKMRLYVNGYTTINVTHMQTPTGYVEVPRVVESSHVIVSPQYTNMGLSTHGMYMGGLDMQTPQDVCGVLTARHDFADNMRTFDMRNGLPIAAGDVRLSGVLNALPSDYMARTINGIRAAHFSEEGTDAYQFAASPGPYDRARELIHERDPARVAFLRWIEQNTSFHDARFMTYNELCHLSPGLDNRVQVYMTGGMNQLTPPVERGQTEDWYVATKETEIATTLTNAIPAMMSTLMLTVAEIRISNMTTEGHMSVAVMNAASFAGRNLDLTPYCHRLEDRIARELMPGITAGNMIAVDIAMRVDLYGDAHLTISVNGGQYVPYGMPIYCNAMYTPMLVTNQQTLMTLATDLGYMANNVGMGLSSTSNTNTLGGYTSANARSLGTL